MDAKADSDRWRKYEFYDHLTLLQVPTLLLGKQVSYYGYNVWCRLVQACAFQHRINKNGLSLCDSLLSESHLT